MMDKQWGFTSENLVVCWTGGMNREFEEAEKKKKGVLGKLEVCVGDIINV